MPHNRPVTLKVASRRDFAIPLFVVFVLGIVSALLSPQPALMAFLVCILFGAGWFTYTLSFYKVHAVKSVSVSFPDGRLRLKSGYGLEIEGFLEGQQWCSHHVAVLHYLAGGKRQHLVLLSAQQNADEYRRLRSWLQQGFCGDPG